MRITVFRATLERTHGQEAEGHQSRQAPTTEAREAVRQSSLATHAGIWQAEGEVACRYPRRQGLRCMSLICLRKPGRICLTHSPKSSPIPSAVRRSCAGSMGGTSPELACKSRTASTSSTPTRLSLLKNTLRVSPDMQMHCGTPRLRRWKKKLFWSLCSRFTMLSDWVSAASVVPWSWTNHGLQRTGGDSVAFRRGGLVRGR